MSSQNSALTSGLHSDSSAPPHLRHLIQKEETWNLHTEDKQSAVIHLGTVQILELQRLPTLHKTFQLVLVELILTLAFGEALNAHLHRVHKPHAMQREVNATGSTVDLPTPSAVVLQPTTQSIL